ncbi:MAG: site-specific integrase [Lachnospiraceae bacterium]|nr:site-specific integrase [Lachnospiraceae bacterium]
MNIEAKISTIISEECKLTDKALIQTYIMNRRDAILSEHINNVDQIHEPGYAGFKYYTTKLTPKNRNHSGLIYAKTKEELETKIIAYYLQVKDEACLTVRKALVSALGGDEYSFGKTPRRTLQRFDKNLSDLSQVKVSQLTEADIRKALDKLVSTKPTEKEFNETVSSLNKLADYCQYEHIEAINIREVIAIYRKVRLTGKHIWKVSTKQTKNLAFTRAEASKIVRYALRHPSYKAFSVAILITTGLRAGELLGLEIDDVYLSEGYLWIHQSEDTKTYELLDYVKENKSREVYLSDEALTILKSCLEYRLRDASNSPFLLLNPCSSDRKMHLRAVDDFMREVIHTDVLGYSKEREARSPHDCRRTYASLEHLSGTPINVIMDQLGHSNVGQTWEYIKNVVEASERRRQLKGGRLIFQEVTSQEPHKDAVNAV